MSESVPVTTSAASIRRPPTPALLTLDAAGQVLHASAAAGTLWQTEPARLAGTAFPNLFVFEIISQDPTWIEAQWEVLVASALDKSIPLHAQPFESGPLPVRLHLETAGGDRAAYFASITPDIAAPASAGRPAAATDTSGLEVLAAQSNLGFFDLDLKSGRIRYSPAWKRQLGYPESELPDTYETWLRLIHPEDSAAAPDRVGKKALSGSRNFSVEFRMKHRRGHWVWLQCTGVQIFSAAGELERVIGAHTDITERKELEEPALLAEERFLRLATDGSLAAFDFDFAQQQFWCSPAWQRLVGAEEPDADGNLDSFVQALPPDVAEQGVEPFFLGPATGQNSFVMAASLRRRDGTELRVVLGVSRQLTRRRDLARVVGFAVPLPVGIGAASADAPSAELMAVAFATIGEAVILTDSHAGILYLSPSAERLTGYSLTAARALKLGDVFRLVTQSEGRPADDAVDLVLAAEQKPRLYAEHALVSATGGPPVPIVWTVRQSMGDRGSAAGLVVVFRDPQQMTLTPEELVRANRFDTLGQLAGGIAHDFNNLLTTILGGISHAKENREYTHLEDAEKACLAAKTLTRQLLTFAKGSESGTFQVLSPVDLLRDAVRLAAAGSTAKITIETAEDTAPIDVNRGQILQVFQNLIINALQAMPDQSKGALWLRCQNIEIAEAELPPLAAGVYVQIDVEDNGSGIPPENLEKIFEPFFTTKKQGTGLGLATVLSIVRKHGGHIGVDSSVGVGTTFTVFLPKAERAAETEARRAPALRYGTGRVLFMDDDAKICDLTGNMLASLDYKYDIAKNGEEAIALYRRYLNVNRPYDAVIMDLTVVGGMGGEECFQHLKALDPNVRAIVSSGYDSEEMAQRYLDMGFCGYLTKPYRVGDLGKILKSVLGP